MNKNPIPVSNPHQFIKSENDHHSFSFEKSQDSMNNKSIKGQQSCNNTATHKFTKMLEDFELKQSKQNIMRTFCKGAQEFDNNVVSNSKVMSPSQQVSMKSFNNMTNYVKNTFRKQKVPSERKDSFQSYSSYRKYELIDKNISKQANIMRTNRNRSQKSNKHKSKKSSNGSSIRDYLEHIDKATLQKLFSKNQQLKDDLQSSYK